MKCTECDGEIRLVADSTIGEIVVCPDCGTDFEVTDYGIKLAESVGEDWGE